MENDAFFEREHSNLFLEPHCFKAHKNEEKNYLMVALNCNKTYSFDSYVHFEECLENKNMFSAL